MGQLAEYDQWLQNTAPQADRLGRSQAIQSMGIGQTIDVPVVVHNWSTQPQTGAVSLDLPADFTIDATSKPYDVQPGADQTVTFKLTNTDTTLPANQNVSIPIHTATGTETLTLTLVPTTVIPQATPVVDGKAEPGEYPGQTLDLGRIWQGAATCTGVDDCGVSSTGEGSTAKVSWSDDALFFFIHVRDDYQSYAVTPAECVGHWQADSVEILLDPRGNASEASEGHREHVQARRLPVHPERRTVLGTRRGQPPGLLERRPRHRQRAGRPGRVDCSVGRQQRDDGAARVRRWRLRPRGEDPARRPSGRRRPVPARSEHHAVRQRRHISTWYDDVAPHRHEHAAGMVGARIRAVRPVPLGSGDAPRATPRRPTAPTTPTPPNVSNPNLNGALSPQTIAQSARNGVPISGRVPTDDLKILSSTVRPTGVDLVTSSKGTGTARAFLTSGQLAAIPVWTTSCATDPPPDYGFTPCAITDGATPPWSPNMSGHLVNQATQGIARGVQHWTIPLTAAQRAQLKDQGHLLVSYETTRNEVQAFDIRMR